MPGSGIHPMAGERALWLNGHALTTAAKYRFYPWLPLAPLRCATRSSPPCSPKTSKLSRHATASPRSVLAPAGPATDTSRGGCLHSYYFRARRPHRRFVFGLSRRSGISTLGRPLPDSSARTPAPAGAPLAAVGRRTLRGDPPNEQLNVGSFPGKGARTFPRLRLATTLILRRHSFAHHGR